MRFMVIVKANKETEAGVMPTGKELAEAIEWVKRVPMEDAELEIRQVFESDDFGAEFTRELRVQEERIRAQTASYIR